MWPLPKINYETIHLILHQDRIICLLFERKNMQIYLRAYKEDHLQIGTGRLLANTEGLYTAVRAFIEGNKAEHAFLHIGLGQDILTENLICHEKSDATLQALIADPAEQSSYYVQHIGPWQDRFMHHVCAVSKFILFQIHLLQLKLPTHITEINSPLHAQIALFKHAIGSSFCQAKLMKEIDTQRIEIPVILSPEYIQKSISISPEITYDRIDLAHALGSIIGAYT